MQTQTESRKIEDVIPEPLHFSWKDGLPFVAECYPPNRHPEWTPQVTGQYLAQAKEAGVRTIYMPNFSRAVLTIAKKSDLNTRTVRNGVEIRTNRKLPVGGIYPIEAGEGCAIAIGGCSVIVLVLEKRDTRTSLVHRSLIILHGMRDMLIDRLMVLAEPERRKLLTSASILKEADALLARLGIPPGNVSLVSLFSIRPENFIHLPDADKTYGEYNQKLPEYLRDTYGREDLLIETRNGPGLYMPAVITADAHKRGYGRVVTTKNLPDRRTDKRGFVDTSLGPVEGRRRNLALVYVPAE